MSERIPSPYGAIPQGVASLLNEGERLTRVPLVPVGFAGRTPEGDKAPATSAQSTQSPQEGKMSHKPDELVAKNEGGTFHSHPEGQFAARCVDVIDFGEKHEEAYGETPERLTRKCGLVFRTGETNPETKEYIDISREFTVSMHEKANLRGFLEAWRGKSYSDSEVEEGAPLHKLVNVTCLITVEHRKSGKGRTYANVKGISPLPKQMAAAAPSADGYTRPEYLTERKSAYATEAAKFRARINAPKSKPEASFSEFPEAMEGDDDLPF